jgi:tetratricopeptide (TPR) repeat protein
MDVVTYPNAEVVKFIQENTIPLRVPFDAKPLSSEFNIKWTPTLIVLDPDGKERHRIVGFVSADELIPSLLLGMGKSYFEQDRFSEALLSIEKLLREYPKSSAAPEGIYLRGVCRYKSTNNPKPLKEAYEQLKDQYPESEWTKRAYPYRLIN